MRRPAGTGTLLAGGRVARLVTALPQRPARPVIALAGRAVLVWLAVVVVASADRPLDRAGVIAATLAAGIWLVTLHAAAAGAPYALGPWVPATIGAATGLICIAALNPYVTGLGLSIPALLGAALGVLASSGIWESVVRRPAAKRRVLVIGSSAVADVAAAASRQPGTPFEVLGGLGSGEPAALRDLDELAAVVRQQRPDLIVLTDEQICDHALDRLLDLTDCRFRVAGLSCFFEDAFGCVPLAHLKPVWFMSLLHLRQRADRRPSKRGFDIVVAGLGLLLTAPLIALLALLVKTTPGPAIYRQVRVGEGGRRFTICKLRTMRLTAEQPGEPVYAQPSDPRCTTVGSILRLTHLDELPQFWNVLKGDMSMVGPRPERPEFVAQLETTVPFWNRRLLMRPGMTGWAQVRFGYAADAVSSAEKLSYDFWYMRHGSLIVDLAVCVRTVLLVIGVLDPRRLLRRQTREA